MHLFWWELLEMLRRFLLVGLLSIINPGSIMQLGTATIFCILFSSLQLQAKPCTCCHKYEPPIPGLASHSSMIRLAQINCSLTTTWRWATQQHLS